MTREEAKEILTHNWTRVDNPNYSESELDEAVDMAIEALHREEAEEKGYCHRIIPSNVEVVVRCKDCRRNNDGNFCDIAFFINDDGDGFCNCGERREP